MTRNRHPETSSPGDARIALAVLFSGMFVLASVGCSSGTSPEADVARRDLDPPSNLGFREQMPEIHSSQPHRTKPRDVVVAPSRDRLYIALPGSIDHPENEVVAFDTRRREIARRFRVGRSPAGLALHPNGRYLVVTNRFSNYLSVVDLGAGEVSAHRTDFYLVDPAFSPSGDRLYAANRWRDSLQTWTA
ncbi:MAG: YncE family protein, partial [Bradymonadaceae bacterium]